MLSCLLWLTTFYAHSTNYYVRIDGNDGNTGKANTPAGAFKTIGNACTKALPGDTILIADGTYEENAIYIYNKAGSKDKKLVLKAINLHKAKLITLSTVAIQIDNSTGVTIDGLEITTNYVYSKFGILALKGHWITVRNCYVHDIGAVGIQLNDGEHFLIEGNITQHNAWRTGDPNGSGISVYHPIYAADYQEGEWGIIIRNNISFDNICTQQLPSYPIGVPVDGNGIIVDDFQNKQGGGQEGGYNHPTLVENNLSFNNGGRGIHVFKSDYVTVRNNTFYHNNSELGKYPQFFSWNGDLNIADSHYAKVYNNIVVMRPTNTGGYALLGIDDTDFYNNIAVGPSATFQFVPASNGYEPKEGTLPSSNQIRPKSEQSYPRFVNPKDSVGPYSTQNPLFSRFFGLQANSPAINSGTNNQAPATDLEGKARPVSGLTDIGTYEYGTPRPLVISFVRAINFAGSATTIEGKAWEGKNSTNYTTTAQSFTAPTATLIPAVSDTAKANMIRSSIWGSSPKVTLTNLPSKPLDIYIYVWEDNAAQTYSISLQGTAVLSNFNSGPAGTWKRLGPFRTSGTSVTIQTNGGDANLSGVEIYQVTDNVGPVVQLPAPTLTATPVAAKKVQLQWTNDAEGESNYELQRAIGDSDTFTTIAFLAANTTSFADTTVAANRPYCYQVRAVQTDSLASTVTSIYSNTACASTPPESFAGRVFYRGININGPAGKIDGKNWAGKTTNNYTIVNGYAFENQSVPLIPAVSDTVKAKMLRSAVGSNSPEIRLLRAPSGTYDVYLYVWEDNFPQTFSIYVEGQLVEAKYNSGPGGTWKKLGPWRKVVTDGTINVSSSGGAANFSGIEVWYVGSSTSNTRTASTNELEGANAAQVSVFPNPVQSSGATVQLQGLVAEEAVSLSLQNLTGRTLWTGKASSDASGIVQADLTGFKLTPGLYMVKVTTATQTYTTKLVVE